MMWGRCIGTTRATQRAYAACELISFEGMQYRRDIASAAAAATD